MSGLIKRSSRRRFRINEVSPATNIILSTLMIALALLVFAPVLLVFIVSISSPTSLVMNGYSFFPSEFSAIAYTGLFRSSDLLVNAYLMTIFYSVSSTLFSLFFTSMISYAIALKKFPLRTVLAFYIYFSGVLSGGLVPQYILYTRYLQINDTIWVFILPTMVAGFNVIVMRTFIQRAIPEALFEAATIDGANDWTIYWKIVLPLSKAALATIGLLLFVAKWNEWFTGILYAQNPRLIPIMTLLQKMERNIDYLRSNTQVAQTSEALILLRDMPTESTRMAITFLVSVPLLMAYPFFQRFFVKGMVVGSVKG